MIMQGSNIKPIDASWYLDKTKNETRQSDFINSRLPGSTFFDIDDICDATSHLPHMLPSADVFAQKVGELGISPESHVVIYTKNNCFSSARVWWMFRLFNHQRVSILDGGFGAWESSGGEIESGEFEPQEKASYDIPKANRKLVADMSEVNSVVSSGMCQICDARSAERFAGIVPEPRPGVASGHIPGSLNLPFQLVLKEGDMCFFRSPEEISRIFEGRGIVRGAKVIFTCGSGVTAAVLAFARRLTNVPEDLSVVYDGSWSEWGSVETTPKISMKNTN